jgi:ABC-type antimicrobial peptide transport system permease subunit
VISEILYPRRAVAWIVGVAGLAGLSLAAIGLYGVTSYSVAQRLPELGIRATLGAGRSDLVRMVLGEGLKVAAIAAVPGAALSVIALRLTSSLVGQVPTTDIATFTVVPLLTVMVILLACYVPAQRASRVEPAVVLRGH